VFEVAASSYDRFMGVYSTQLAPQLADYADVHPGQRVLDVGCGPGILTGELVARIGADRVSAVDPSGPFVAATRDRYPGVDVRQAAAEDLPYAAGTFDRALAQLVVHFMSDPVAGLREMKRATKDGGIVAASVWDLAGDRSPLTLFWQTVHSVDPGGEGESYRPGSRAGELVSLFREAGLGDVEETESRSSVTFERFEDWWKPFTLGVGPAGGYVGGLGDEERAALYERARELVPEPPFTVEAVAWTVRARA
jgi:SAM-dependent methyltransferase